MDTLLHEEKTVVYGDAAYRGTQNCTRAKAAGRMFEMCPGKRARQGKVSVSGDLTAGWIRESTLTWSEEKHRITENAVHAVRSPDGAPQAVEM